MKTISGLVVSSKSVSLSKAASVMNKFISDETENGAPAALSVYLRRTSAAINELVEFHKELKSKRSDRKRKRSRLDMVENGNLKENLIDEKLAVASNQDQSLVVGEKQKLTHSGNSESLGTEYEGMKIKKKKKKKKKNMKSDGSDNEREIEERGNAREEVEKSKERKKRKKMAVEDGGFDDAEERHRMKKKKKRKHESED